MFKSPETYTTYIAPAKQGGNKLLQNLMVAAGLFGASALAMADGTGIDLSPINAAITQITSVGTLVFTVFVTVKTFLWIRKAL